MPEKKKKKIIKICVIIKEQKLEKNMRLTTYNKILYNWTFFSWIQ